MSNSEDDTARRQTPAIKSYQLTPKEAKDYRDTLNAIEQIPSDLTTIFTSDDVVNSLKTKHRSYLNERPFEFFKDNGHVWLVLKALETVLDDDYKSFSKGKAGRRLDKNIFGKFVSVACNLRKDKRLLKQIWIVVFLHDIAKYSVRNADHAQISGNLARDLFECRDFGFAELELERIAWLIGNHDVVGNIVSSAERAPRCLTEGLEELSDEEKQTRLNMLIVLSLCDLRGTKNGKFVNDDNATARFWAADLDWLRSKEEDLFGWRKERLVRAYKGENTKEKRELWDETFSGLRKDTKTITENQFGKNIKVFTNLLYLALGLKGGELAKLFTIVSLMAEMATEGKPNLNFQVDFTKGADRGGSGPIINGFETLLKEITLDDLALAKITENYNKMDQTIYSIPISYHQNHLTVDSKKIGDD